MMRKMIVIAVALATLSADAYTFRPEPIRAHMSFLASDLLEGRGTATRGHQIAARYVASQFEAAGIGPGANGSYFQIVPFRRTVLQPERTSLTISRPDEPPVTLTYGEEFIATGDALNTDKRVEAPAVFVGFGITAPDQHYDSYAGMDVRGKVVVIVSGAPETFSNTLRAHYSSSSNKIETAAAHGAVALLRVDTPEAEARSPWSRSVRNSKAGSMHWLAPDGVPHDVVPALSVSATLNGKGVERLFVASAVTAAEAFSAIRTPAARSFDLGVTVALHVVSTHDRVESPNVVGIVRGTDPKLQNEYVVYSSHLDHLGITEPVDGDAINNGAFDNASGVAAMLEIARAFVTERPRRSIMLVATTGEEKGLRGADFFANNPTVPIDSIVANINIDQIMMFAPTRDLVAYGEEHSDLGVIARAVAKRMHVEISPDPYPEEVIFVRSDQYRFVQRGVPAIFVEAGHKAVDAKIDLLSIERAWLRNRYHGPKDDMDQPMDLREAVMLTTFDYLVGQEVANRTARPRWNRGDFFGEKFGRK